jgi:hypothetical protein
MNTEITTIDEEHEEMNNGIRSDPHGTTVKSALTGGKATSPTLSPRSAAKPKRTRSNDSSSPRSPVKGLLSFQFMNGNSISALEAINLDDLPLETRQPRQIRKSRADARERLHNSMSDLEGFTPEDLMQEVNRRRQERVQQRQKLSNPATSSGRTQENAFRSSTSSNPSGDFKYETHSSEFTPNDTATDVPTNGVAVMEEARPKIRYGWQTPDCCGALEVACELEWDYKGRLEPRYVEEFKEFFDTSCLPLWKKMKLVKEFRNACSAVPCSTTCCGLVHDDDQTIQDTANALNKGWIKDVNQRLKTEKALFRLDVYAWTWYHIQAKKISLLVRFFVASR